MSLYTCINIEQVRIIVFGEDLFYHMVSKLHHHLRPLDKALKHFAQPLTVCQTTIKYKLRREKTIQGHQRNNHYIPGQVCTHWINNIYN